MLFLKVCIALLLIVTSSYAVPRKDKYGKRNGTVELQLGEKPQEPVTNIIWKFKSDKAAEWFKEDGDEVTYFPAFKDWIILNKATWSLKISNLQDNFTGEYSAEVNNKEPTKILFLSVIGPVLKPTISGCNDSPETDNCTLTCDGSGEGPLTYTWSDDEGLKTEGQMLYVEKKSRDVVYTCKLSNPVSEAESSETVPKRVEQVEVSHSKAALGVGLVFLFLILLLSVYLIPIIVRRFRGYPTGFSFEEWRKGLSCQEDSAENGAMSSKDSAQGQEDSAENGAMSSKDSAQENKSKENGGQQQRIDESLPSPSEDTKLLSSQNKSKENGGQQQRIDESLPSPSEDTKLLSSQEDSGDGKGKQPIEGVQSGAEPPVILATGQQETTPQSSTVENEQD